MKARKSTSPLFQGRRFFLMLALLVLLGILLLRAMWLEVFQQSWLQEQADRRQTSVVKIPAYRGMIVDRHGEPLAISSPVESLWCHPGKLLEHYARLRGEHERMQVLASGDVEDTNDNGALNQQDAKKYLAVEKAFSQVEQVLELDEGELFARLEQAKDKRFFYLGRHLPPEVADQVLALDLDGVGSTREYRRFYPMTETAGHVVGMTNIDGVGIEGIERVQNEALAGKIGKKRVIRDGRRRSVEDVERLVDMVPGQTIELSLDKRIQYLAYKALMGQVYKLNARAGSAVVMDAQTGEILAMTNLPSFNPNNRKSIKPYLYRNRAVTDKFEPGSTLKPLTMAAALESRVIGADVEIETAPGFLKFGKHRVRDPKNYGTMSLSRILAKSSNVGASRVALLMPPRDHWMFLNRVGFGQVPNAGLSSETAGNLSSYMEWTDIDRASHGYGYGMSTSLLQLTHAYTPFAAQGRLMPASIYRVKESPIAQQVMSRKTAESVLSMMEAVVQEGGTGKRAIIDGYRVAGKTGTAFKYVNGKYRNDKFMTSFIGIAPASKPRLVVSVQIDEPKIDDSGGRAAAPVFSKIMSESLRILDIPPDDLPEKLQQADTEAVKAGAS